MKLGVQDEHVVSRVEPASDCVSEVATGCACALHVATCCTVVLLLASELSDSLILGDAGVAC